MQVILESQPVDEMSKLPDEDSKVNESVLDIKVGVMYSLFFTQLYLVALRHNLHQGVHHYFCHPK